MSQNKSKSFPVLFILLPILLISLVFMLMQLRKLIVAGEDVTPPKITEQEPGSEGGDEKPSAESDPDDRLPNLDDSYEDHLYLNWKGRGDCNRLSGEMMLTIVFVSDSDCEWSEEEITDYHKQQLDAARYMMVDASTYGSELNVQVQYFDCEITGTVNINNYNGWINDALRAAQLPSRKEFSQQIKEQFMVDEAPVIFCVNRQGRAFSVPEEDESGFEFAVLFRQDADFRHEFYHMYGAKDYFSPDFIKEIADPFFADSIMMQTGDNAMADSLTAYLVGWTDQLSAEAQSFLDQTAHLKDSDLAEYEKMRGYTGEATWPIGDGVYSGDFVEGVPYGDGVYSLPDGSTYEGQWVYGEATGTGTLTWPDGSNYVGEVVNMLMHGTGVFTGADGTVYDGIWEYGNFLG